MAERVPVEPIEVEKKESELKDTVADMEVESKTKQSKWTKKEKAGTKGIIEKSEYKEEAEIAVAKSKELAKMGEISEATRHLYIVEKKARLVSDAASTKMLARAILEISHDALDWKALNNNILVLCKRRAQLKQVVQLVVEVAMSYIPELENDTEGLVELLETLRQVTMGKIYTELEAARLTRHLTDIKEREGDVAGASKCLQELTVETIGAMDMREKAEILLEQIRLCVATKDFIRANMISKKVKVATLDKDEFLDLKLKYCSLMTKYFTHESDMFGLAQLNHSLYKTPKVHTSEGDWQKPLQRVMLFMALAPHTNELSDMIHRVAADKRIEELPACQQLVKYFTQQEIVPWPLPEEAALKPLAVFSGISDTEEKADEGEDAETTAKRGDEWWAMLHRRVTEHSIRVVSKYYKRLTLARFGELLDASPDEVEDHVCQLVADKGLWAKIDRPAGIITFQQAPKVDEVLHDWSNDLGKVMQLVDGTCHIINKEKMMAEAAAKAGGGGGGESKS